jgi:hypothetical protein
MHNRSICSVNYIITKDSAEYISVSILKISFRNRFSLVARETCFLVSFAASEQKACSWLSHIVAIPIAAARGDSSSKP